MLTIRRSDQFRLPHNNWRLIVGLVAIFTDLPPSGSVSSFFGDMRPQSFHYNFSFVAVHAYLSCKRLLTLRGRDAIELLDEFAGLIIDVHFRVCSKHLWTLVDSTRVNESRTSLMETCFISRRSKYSMIDEHLAEESSGIWSQLYKLGLLNNWSESF